MIYQQEAKEVNDFYKRFKDKKIVYSREVSRSIGLNQNATSIKLGSLVLKGALISSTMESFVIMARLDDSAKREIFDQKGMLTVQLTFVDRESGKDLLFTIHTKFLNMNNQGLDQKDLNFIALESRRKIPNDLIKVFGSYHKEAESRRKLKKKKVECLLLANERKTDCLAESITKNQLVLGIEETPSISIDVKAIAILKIVNTGEVMEIIGNIREKRIEPDGRCRVLLQYQMEDQSPRFGYSIHVLKNIINS